ncbi:MAG: hypothetical protein R2694_13020 [Ilumatobacteraceae bacterium]|nr:hypothetical protein [Ilumatobacter sp.]MCB0984243.1 hypothetical protein [Ilumatobacter sp.]
MAESDDHPLGHRPADPDGVADPVVRRVAELSAALQDAQAAEGRAKAALAAAQALNAVLLAQCERGTDHEEVEALRARAALADEMAATRTWRWSRLPRRVWGRIRRLVRRGAAAAGTGGGG